MSFKIKLSDASQLDLREANRYYMTILKDLYIKFKIEISEPIERIANSPNHFQKRYRNIRIVFTNIFPFGVHYLLEGN